MGSRRTLIVVAAVVIGAIAAVSLYSYVNGVEDRAYGDAKRVEVYTVEQDVPQGTPGATALEEGLIDSSLIPQEFRPATALTRESVEGLRSLVALSDLSAGQVVVEGMFVSPERAFVSSSQQIEEGRVAITISVDEVRGVAGLIVPGDKVNVIARNPEFASGGGEGAVAESGGGLVPTAPTTLLYQNVEVLAVGASLVPPLGEAQETPEDGVTTDETAPEINANLITLAVPPLAASQIAAVGSDNIWLTLVAPDNAPVEVPQITNGNILPDALTPYPDEDL